MKSFLLLLFLGIVHADECYSKANLLECYERYNSQPKLCDAGVRATCLLRNRTACPACVPSSMYPLFCGRLASTKTCAPTKKPTPQLNVTSGEICPSCIPAYVKPTCTETKLKECHAKLQNMASRPAVCERGELPQKDSSGCCVTCTPKAASCTPTNFGRCRAAFKGTRDCDGDERSIIGDNCCRTCKPVRDIPKKSKAGKCSRAELKRALKTVPVCEEGEDRITDRDSLSCAPSCKRPESDFNSTEVFECVKSLKPCAANSKPVRLPGTRCPVCYPKRPVCASCPAARMCGRVPESKMNRTLVKKCLRKHKFKLKLKAKKNFLQSYQPSQVDRVLVEFAERFCERNSAAEKCDKYLDRLRDSIKCSRVKTFGLETTVTVEIAEDETEDASSTNRRLLQNADNGATDLLNEAIQDDADLISSIKVTTSDVSKNMVSHAMIILLASISMIFLN